MFKLYKINWNMTKLVEILLNEIWLQFYLWKQGPTLCNLCANVSCFRNSSKHNREQNGTCLDVSKIYWNMIEIYVNMFDPLDWCEHWPERFQNNKISMKYMWMKSRKGLKFVSTCLRSIGVDVWTFSEPFLKRIKFHYNILLMISGVKLD